MEQLDNDKNVIYWEKCSDRIPYIDHNGISHYYIPDIKIFTKNKIIVEEIKPKILVDKELNKIKFEYAEKYYNNINIEFIVVTEDKIGIDNIKSFNPDGLMKLTKEMRDKQRKDRRNEQLRKKRKEKKTCNRKSVK